MAISRAALIDLLQESNFEVVGSAANADKAWEELQHINVDLALLDINLAGKNDGIWLAQKIRETLNIAIVFLTAYGDQETITKLSALNPNGYLMKPYNKPTLITTIDIALKTFANLNATVTDSTTDNLFVIVEESVKKVKIYLKDIYYIISEGNYVEIHLKNKTHIVRTKLKSLIETFPNNNYIVQVHLRYAVNMNEASSISANNITIKHVNIPVSKTYKKLLLDHFSAK